MKLTRKISLLIADDHRMVADLLEDNLSREKSFTIVGKVTTAIEAIEQSRNLYPDILLVDVNIKPVSAFEVMPALKNFCPYTKVIGLSSLAVTSQARKMKEIGGAGFISKYSPFHQVKNAIRSACRGEFYYCDYIRELMALEEKLHINLAECHHRLTEREMQVVDLIKKGFNSPMIAARLGISVKTVHIHRNNIFKKLQVKNVASLILAVQGDGFPR